MHLLHLPAEVLHEIIKATLPSGFEAFMLTSHQVYQNGERLIHYHNFWKSQSRLSWRVYDPSPGEIESGKVPKPLPEAQRSKYIVQKVVSDAAVLSKDCAAAQYIRKIILYTGDSDNIRIQNSLMAEANRLFDEPLGDYDEMTPEIEELVRQFRENREAGNRCRGTDAEAMIYAMLRLCPNVTFLGLEQVQTENLLQLPSVLGRVIDYHSDNSLIKLRQPGAPALPLTTLLLTILEDADYYVPLETILPLLFIPTLRRAHLDGVMTSISEPNRPSMMTTAFQSLDSDGRVQTQSKLQALELNGDFEVDDLRSMLSRMPHLKHLFIRHRWRFVDYSIKGLLSTAGDQLESLGLVHCIPELGYRGDGPIITRLTGFSKVKYLEINVDPNLWFGSRRDFTAYFHNAYLTKQRFHPSRVLVDVLPQSLETLALLVPHCLPLDLAGYFHNFTSRVSSRLPKLKQIIIVTICVSDREMRRQSPVARLHWQIYPPSSWPLFYWQCSELRKTLADQNIEVRVVQANSRDFSPSVTLKRSDWVSLDLDDADLEEKMRPYAWVDPLAENKDLGSRVGPGEVWDDSMSYGDVKKRRVYWADNDSV